MKLIDIISEDVDLDEGKKGRSQEEWLNDYKNKFPDWDYSDAIFFKEDGGKHKIKNIKCKIHNTYFPEEGRTSGIELRKHLNGIGCIKCGKERFKIKNSYTKEQWFNSLLNIKHLKDKIDFTNIKFSYVEPLQHGPLITNMYCKVHKKYINGGENNQGVRANKIKEQKNVCPLCIKDTKFTHLAKSFEDWIKEFKSNKRNKNFDFSKTEIYTFPNTNTYAFNISCNVMGLNGKKHGMFGEVNKSLDNEGGINAFNIRDGVSVCPKCKCENSQTNFIEKSIEIHYDEENGVRVPRYYYDKVDFCDSSTILKVNDSHSRKVLIGCKNPEHGYFFQRTSSHLQGKGCPLCRVSKGEDYIYKLLKSKFGEKYTIERENKNLFSSLGIKRFDFYIPELKVLIEYDGEGHFWPIFGSSDYTRNLKYNEHFDSDNLKNNVIKGKKNNPTGIRLIRVPYTLEFNEIDRPLLDAIKNAPPNQVTYIGDYPKRHNRKEVESKFKVDLSQPIQKPRRMTESKLSLINTLKDIE